MLVLRSETNLDLFFRGVGAAPARALLLDYDGTLAPFRQDRDHAVPYAGVRERLNEILEGGRTRISIVSGRPLADLARLLGLQRLPELWGSHGQERRTSFGELVASPPSAELVRLVDRSAAWAAEHGWAERFERKPYGLAFHGRGVDPALFERIRTEAIEKWQSQATALDLELLDFDGGFEFRPAGGHKGQVLEAVAGEVGPDAAIAYLGDDQTDEDAFEALRGRGLAVLVRPVLRPTAADVWLVPPEELLDFLDRWARAARTGN